MFSIFISIQIAAALGPWYVLYFMIVIFFGSFYLINLVLAVVAVSYQQETAQNADLVSNCTLGPVTSAEKSKIPNTFSGSQVVIVFLLSDAMWFYFSLGRCYDV